jgi:hypothetical protein
MGYTNIPTRSSADLNAAADINALMGNTDYILGIINPVKAWYTQYPSAESNTKTTAFPTADEPAELFGGTWVQYYEDEGLFFKTEGDVLSQTDGENNVRTTGLQTDAGQGHYHAILNNAASNIGTDQAGSAAGSLSGLNNASKIGAAITDGTNGTPRTGKETRPRNRLFKIWYRTA